MLPAAARLRRRKDFTAVVRRGRRVGRAAVVVHRLSADTSDMAPRVGFVVGRAVGNAVRRHEVTRRLRHVMRDRLDRLTPGDRLVIRAAPTAAGRSSADLGEDVDRALAWLGVPATAPSGPVSVP